MSAYQRLFTLKYDVVDRGARGVWRVMQGRNGTPLERNGRKRDHTYQVEYLCAPNVVYGRRGGFSPLWDGLWCCITLDSVKEYPVVPHPTCVGAGITVGSC